MSARPSWAGCSEDDRASTVAMCSPGCARRWVGYRQPVSPRSWLEHVNGRPAPVARASPAALRGDRDAARRRESDRSGSGHASHPSGHHVGLRQRRSARPVRGHPPLAGGRTMSDLAQSLEEYLAVRRAVGFTLKTEERMLADFVRYAEQAGVSVVTTEIALAWARLPAKGSAHWLVRRLRMVRGFARHLNAVDPRTEIPPVDLLVGSHRRPNPHVYSDAETAALLRAADGLRPPLRAATMRALIGLLAVSGLFSRGQLAMGAPSWRVYPLLIS